MGLFLTKVIIHFCVAFGVVMGATLMTGVASILTLQPPTLQMQDIAEKIRIWAVVAAVGGTIDPFRSIESHFIVGELSPALQQILIIVSAFLGAQLGAKLAQWLSHGEWFL